MVLGALLCFLLVAATLWRRNQKLSGASPCRAAGPGQERLPGQHEPRDPHPHECHHRLQRPGTANQSGSPAAGLSQQDQILVGHLLLLINDILDLTKVESGKLTLEEIDFDLSEQLDLAAMFADLAERKHIEVIINKSPAVPDFLRGDPLRLGQVLVNLVNNAIKFTERGEVEVAITLTSQHPMRVCFSVRIPASASPRRSRPSCSSPLPSWRRAIPANMAAPGLASTSPSAWWG
jgi:hypothetical protein